MKNEEIWKDIKGYEGLYQVSNKGRVKSLDRKIKYSNGIIAEHRSRILKPSYDKRRGWASYGRVTLSKDDVQERFLIHRIVAIHFIERGLDDQSHVNHKDGDPRNNSVDNLEWCTPSENERHSYDVLGKVNANRRLDSDAIEDIRNNAKKGTGSTNPGNVEAFMNKYGVSRSTVLNVLNERYYV